MFPAAAAAKSLQSCLTLCDPRDGSPPGSPVPGILQARTLEWVVISFSNAWKWKVKVKAPCRVRLFATPWTAAHQAPPSMGFSRQEYWKMLPTAPLEAFGFLTPKNPVVGAGQWTKVMAAQSRKGEGLGCSVIESASPWGRGSPGEELKAYMSPYVKWIASGNMPCDAGSSDCAVST